MKLTPTPKAGSAGIAGASSVIVIWVLNAGFHITVPPEIASAITTVLAFAAAYFAPKSKGR